jgi:hypothetical protein
VVLGSSGLSRQQQRQERPRFLFFDLFWIATWHMAMDAFSLRTCGPYHPHLRQFWCSKNLLDIRRQAIIIVCVPISSSAVEYEFSHGRVKMNFALWFGSLNDIYICLVTDPGNLRQPPPIHNEFLSIFQQILLLLDQIIPFRTSNDKDK